MRVISRERSLCVRLVSIVVAAQGVIDKLNGDLFYDCLRDCGRVEIASKSRCMNGFGGKS